MKKTRAKRIKEAKEFDKVVAEAKQDMFKFHFVLCGEVFEGKGNTALEALRNLPSPQKITTKGVLTISHGERTKVLTLLIPKVKRIFYPNFQSVIIKQLVYGL